MEWCMGGAFLVVSYDNQGARYMPPFQIKLVHTDATRPCCCTALETPLRRGALPLMAGCRLYKGRDIA